MRGQHWGVASTGGGVTGEGLQDDEAAVNQEVTQLKHQTGKKQTENEKIHQNPFFRT